MADFIDVYEMDSRWLVMEFQRLIEVEMKGLADNDVTYSASDLEEQIMFRLREYDNNR